MEKTQECREIRSDAPPVGVGIRLFAAEHPRKARQAGLAGSETPVPRRLVESLRGGVQVGLVLSERNLGRDGFIVDGNSRAAGGGKTRGKAQNEKTRFRHRTRS